MLPKGSSLEQLQPPTSKVAHLLFMNHKSAKGEFGAPSIHHFRAYSSQQTNRHTVNIDRCFVIIEQSLRQRKMVCSPFCVRGSKLSSSLWNSP